MSLVFFLDGNSATDAASPAADASHTRPPAGATAGQQPRAADARKVQVLSSCEFAERARSADEAESMRYLFASQSTYLDAYPEHFAGSFAMPDKLHPLCDPICFAFYLDKRTLTFLDDGTTCTQALESLAQQGMLAQSAPAQCLFEVMKLLMHSDLEFLASAEDEMERTEEDIASGSGNVSNRLLLEYRRKLLRIDTYYQQLTIMTASLADNENRVLTRKEARLFAGLERHAERLLKRSQTLKEYSLQLRELYQTQIDIQQNDVMKLFTVLTALFAPLTLITSWFGMNFANMPGLDWPWGYEAVVAFAIALVAVELVLFKRKGWL